MYVKVALIAGKHWKKIILTLMLIFILIFMFFFGMQQEEEEFEYEGGGVATVSPLVLRYQPLVEKYAAKYGIDSYVPLLLAKIMQETGGRLTPTSIDCSGSWIVFIGNPKLSLDCMTSG